MNRRLPTLTTRDKQINAAGLRAAIFRAAEAVAVVRKAGYEPRNEVAQLCNAVFAYWNRNQPSDGDPK